MRVKITLPGKEAKKIKEQLVPHIAVIEDENFGDPYDAICLIDPGQLRPLTEKVSTGSKGRGGIETLSLKDLEEGDEKL
ncbi:hypothetical protein DSO57_1032144 [Entomophthora muscae]|nr:hypothetical protein DSO57_1032144 [Entomophthora muscae]